METKAFELAEKYNVDFIQLDYVAGEYQSYGTDVKSLNVDSYIKGLAKLKTNVKILGGVWPKYYTPIKGSVLENDIVAGLILCDGIVVTGEGTGKETPLDKIKKFGFEIASTRKFSRTPLIIGAGLDASNVGEQLLYAHGAIVGSAFKPHKRTQEMVSRELVKEFMAKVKKI